ncbi:Membrane-anchored junction protein, partial [Galemys pyrenaicus]
YLLEAMSLKPFAYPFPETRFLHAGPNVYKFKIRYGNSIRGEEIEKKEVISQELEDSIRVVLGNLDNLQPFATEHFIVFPYKSKWERVSHLKFKHGEMALVPYPFVFTLYVELKWFHENLSPTRLEKEDSQEPASSLKVLEDRKAAGAMVRKRKCTEVPSSPSMPALDSIKMRTPSQGPRKKKPVMETRRNGERKAQQERQETPASADTEAQEQACPTFSCSHGNSPFPLPVFLTDSESGDSLAGQITPPLQQNDTPPPRGPTKPGPSGFFGFLRAEMPQLMEASGAGGGGSGGPTCSALLLAALSSHFGTSSGRAASGPASHSSRLQGVLPAPSMPVLGSEGLKSLSPSGTLSVFGPFTMK